MKIVNVSVNKPISLAGCEQVFKMMNIPAEEYCRWNIGKIFDEAERLAKEYNLSIKEVKIDMEN